LYENKADEESRRGMLDSAISIASMAFGAAIQQYQDPDEQHRLKRIQAASGVNEETDDNV